ncbi:MAG TPA: alpha-galactosidase [Lapillicoccus sp.]|nr:alpha-galactosidase [Lapillicoccus sp.]
MRPVPIHHLRSGGVSLVVAIAEGPGLPRVVHWGADLGELSDDELRELALVTVAQVTSYVLDDPVPAAVLPEHALGYSGWPGVNGHRGGRSWSPLFTVTDVARDGATLTVQAADADAALATVVHLELTPSGLVRARAELTNTHTSEPYWVDAVHVALPVPPVADELLDLAGRHTRERTPQRQPFHVGTRLRESRRGKGGHDASLLLVAGTSGFGFGSGEVWGLHVAWSGNQRVYAERLATGAHAVLGGGELLLPGEVRLGPGETYATPWVVGAYGGSGLDELSGRIHAWLRARPHHPTAPRPVILNTWEAVYFDQDLDTLVDLADRAAVVGAERFVLDDGWFRGRRGESAGLGDWFVDTDVWPDGLGPLVDHVRSLGMQFGLWVEPESVNPDSDVARAHPEWVLATGGRQPPLSRLQQLLDVGNPEVSAYLLERLDALLTEYPIDFLKWDLNRDIVDGGRSPGGEPAVHRNTVALYALLDELRRRHPGVEIESCAGGGGRIDLEILQRTERVWASDSNDPLERQQIQRWTSLLVPPELLGAHVGAAHAHTTHRTHTVAFAAGTALFGHFGMELDLTAMSEVELAELGEWVTLAKRTRGLIHAGRTVRGDHPDPAVWVHGVVGQDGGEALFAIVAMQTSETQPPGLVRLPGLDPDRRYRLRLQPPGDQLTRTRLLPRWTATAGPGGPGVVLPGRALGQHGIQAPYLNPGTLVLLHLEAI